MRIPSAYLFFFCISLFSLTQALANPTILQDVSHWLHSPFQKISVTIIIPQDLDFWRSVKDFGDKANIYTDKILKDAAEQYALTSDRINEFKETMSRVVTSAEGMRTILQDVDLEEFENRFEIESARILEELKTEFSEPLPEDQTERYRQQSVMISQALDKTEDALVSVCGSLNIPETTVRTMFDDVKPHINHCLLVVANLVNNHPVLLEILLSLVVIAIFPESSILRCIFRLFGFGPLGPVKGSLAASAQRFFFGGVVKGGSWFSMLQRAGMKFS